MDAVKKLTLNGWSTTTDASETIAASDTVNALGVSRMGLKCLTIHFRTAFTVLTGATTRAVNTTYQQSLAFVMGSDLDLMLETFGIDADPEALRETFLELCQRYHLSSAS